MTEEHSEYMPAKVDQGMLQAANPVQLVKVATEIATELKKIIDAQELFTQIGRKKHVHCEGWTTLAAMMGVTPQEESSTRHDDGSYESVVTLISINSGQVIGRASALCGMDETDNKGNLTWAERDEYARKSMAATRATGKACRLAFSWIMVLGGYSPTPHEEMSGVKQNGGDQGTPQDVKPSSNYDASGDDRLITEAQGRRLYAISKKSGLEDSELQKIVKDIAGVEHSKEIKRCHYEALCSHVEAFKRGEETQNEPDNDDLPW